MFYAICFYFLLFFIYSMIGWVAELVGCTVYEKKLVLNRGFLIGPYCPIYGTAAIVMIFFLKKYLNDPLALFVMAVIVSMILEYVTSYVMEKLFKARWWDYSEKKFNLNGRVCLYNGILFGLLGLFLMYILNPPISKLLLKIPNMVLMIIAVILALLIIADTVLSTIIISQLSKDTSFIKLKDATEVITHKVRDRLSKNRVFKRRLLNAFPGASSTTEHDVFQKMRKIINDNRHKKQKKRKK